MGPSPAGRGGHIPRKTDAGQHQRPETPGGSLSGGRLRYLGQVARVVQQALRRWAEGLGETLELPEGRDRRYLTDYARTLLPRIRTAAAGGWPGIFP